MPRRYRLAAIDIGTNSIHMIVVEASRSGFRVIDREKKMVQLGRGSLRGNPLTAASIDRAINVLREMGELARRWEVDEVVAVATSAAREAPNGQEFVERATRESGIPIRLIQGEEEADLIWRAVRDSVDLEGATVLAIDIGGGSVEMIVGTDDQVFFTRSEPLGALRLSQRFFDGAPTTAEAIEACRRHLARWMRKPAARIRSLGFDRVVGTSGTILALAQLANGNAAEGGGSQTLARKKLGEVIAKLAAVPKAERAGFFKLEERRADTILAGGVILDEILRAAGAEALETCGAALREGVVLRTLDERQVTAPRRGSVRRTAVTDLLARAPIDAKHARYVARLALRIFDQTASLHRLRAGDREMLEYAALLHEIGRQVSFQQYHKHSYYLIRHARLRGFSEEQLAVVANVARYHRKAKPSASHHGLAELTAAQRQLVVKLGAILRLAFALDRSRRESVRDLDVELDERRIVFLLRPRRGADLDPARLRKPAEYFGEVFSVSARVERRDDMVGA
jgi:exopolyphosphatase / guanosine-5'-triphosphate,3'-diphosphate pyrophosphatase